MKSQSELESLFRIWRTSLLVLLREEEGRTSEEVSAVVQGMRWTAEGLVSGWAGEAEEGDWLELRPWEREWREEEEREARGEEEEEVELAFSEGEERWRCLVAWLGDEWEVSLSDMGGLGVLFLGA